MKPCLTSSGRPCNRGTCAVNAARRASETVDAKHRSLAPCFFQRKRTSRSTSFLFFSLSKARLEELKSLALSTQVLQSETGGINGQTYSLFRESSSAALQASTDLKRLKVVTRVRRLAAQEHSAALVQLASCISAIMKFGVGADDDPFVKVKVQTASASQRTDFVHELHNALSIELCSGFETARPMAPVKSFFTMHAVSKIYNMACTNGLQVWQTRTAVSDCSVQPACSAQIINQHLFPADARSKRFRLKTARKASQERQVRNAHKR